MNNNRMNYLLFLMILLPMELWGGTIVLKGKLDVNIPFILYLNNRDKIIEGAAHYDNQKTDVVISIKGTIDDYDGMILTEYEGNKEKGYFKGILRSGVYLGIYTNTNGKTFPFTSSIVDDDSPSIEFADNQFDTSALIFKKNQNNIHVELRVDYPIYGNKDLVGETRLYIRESVEKMFDVNIRYSDLTDGQALINHAGTKKYSDLEKEKKGVNDFTDESEFKEIIEVNKSFENKKCVSFCASRFYCYGGRANKFCAGATFRKKDGTRMLVFKYPISPNLKKIVKDAVKNELGDSYGLVSEKRFENEPMPRELPHLTKYGVQFDYQNYEIGAGALGQVSVVIPYERIKQYVTDEARMLFE